MRRERGGLSAASYFCAAARTQYTHEMAPHNMYDVFQFIQLKRKNPVRTNHDQKQTRMHLYRLESNTYSDTHYFRGTQ